MAGRLTPCALFSRLIPEYGDKLNDVSWIEAAPGQTGWVADFTNQWFLLRLKQWNKSTRDFTQHTQTPKNIPDD